MAYVLGPGNFEEKPPALEPMWKIEKRIRRYVMITGRNI
jgi:hypothetical protein